MNITDGNIMADTLASQLAGMAIVDSMVAKLGELLSAGAPEHRRLIVQALAAGRPKAALPWLIPALVDNDRQVAAEALASIRELMPWMNIRPCAADGSHESALEDAICLAVDQLAFADVKSLVHRLAELYGAWDEISRILDKSRPEFGKQFKFHVSRALARHYPPQITVAITYRCNARCPYCYASVQRDCADSTISREYFVKIVRHAKKLGFERIGFTGGEPSLHPHFLDFIRLVGEQGMHTFFASNCRFNPDFVDSLSSEIVGGVTAHIWFTPDFGGQHEARFIDNLRRMHANGLNIMLRFSITPGDRVPIDDLERIYHESRAQQINMAVAVPNASRFNLFVKNEMMISESARMLESAREMRKRGIRLAFAKPLPPCVPSKGDWRWLGGIPHSAGTCAIWQADKTHNVVVNPNGDIWPCMVLNRPLCRFEDLQSRAQLSELCTAYLRNYPRVIDEGCSDCEFWKIRRCQCGCLAFSQRNPKLQ